MIVICVDDHPVLLNGLMRNVRLAAPEAEIHGFASAEEALSFSLARGCDVLFCETGHHTVQAVCDFAESHNVKRLVFVHHGREILENRESVKEAIAHCSIPVDIAFDGMEVKL